MIHDVQTFGNFEKKVVTFQELDTTFSIDYECDSNDVEKKFYWDDLCIESRRDSDYQNSLSNDPNFFLGKGCFGTVIKASLRSSYIPDSAGLPDTTVAVKILSGNKFSRVENEERHYLARDEAYILQYAQERMFYKEGIIHVYGIVSGPLPSHLADTLQMTRGLYNVGILMKYESGGTLKDYITTQVLDVAEKIRIMECVARGLAELHTLGIIHGDIKLDNILLNSQSPPHIRIADFGFSTIYDNDDHVSYSTRTSFKLDVLSQGTPVYSAPEMLQNDNDWFFDYDKMRSSKMSTYDYDYVYDDEGNRKVARPSRKTDMYAYSILCWEICSQELAFSDVRGRDLNDIVHDGIRPPMNKRLIEMPSEVIQMIKMCWNSNRKLRYSAIECLSLLQKTGPRDHFDIYFSCHPDTENSTEDVDFCDDVKTILSKEELLQYIYRVRHYSLAKTILYHLIRLGYRVCFDIDIHNKVLTTQKRTEIEQNIQKSSVFVVFGNRNYLTSETCMYELKYAGNRFNQNSTKYSSFKSSCRRRSSSILTQSTIEDSTSSYLSNKFHLRRINSSQSKTESILGSPRSITSFESYSSLKSRTKLSIFTSIKGYIQSKIRNIRSMPNLAWTISSHSKNEINVDEEDIHVGIQKTKKPIQQLISNSNDKTITLIADETRNFLYHSNSQDFLNHTKLLQGVRYSNIAQDVTMIKNDDHEFINSETLLKGDNIHKMQRLLHPFITLLKEKNCRASVPVTINECYIV